MTTHRIHQLLDQLRQAGRSVGGQLRSDGDLLACFVERREESAFETLLRRHGPMVLGVCRRLLGNHHDADDAFQATFLVLVRKAASVWPREAVGNFLYGVAYRTALEVRSRIARRRLREKQVLEMPEPEVHGPDGWAELRPLLDRELHRLPDKYRLPIILCDVEGRSRKEVARQLAIPEGTLSSRLATARKRLATRLARFGFALAGASLAGLLMENTASASVPAPLLGETIQAALRVAAGQAVTAGVVSVTVAALTEGVLKTMFVAKVKTATAVLFGVAALGLGTGGLYYQARAGAVDPRPGDSKQPSIPVLAGKSAPAPAEAQRPEKDPLRLAAEEAAAREQELRDELEKARQEVEKLRAEVEEQRQRAEAERQRAEDALREARAQLEKARREEKAARQEDEEDDGPSKKKPSKPANKGKAANRRGMSADQQKALAELDAAETKLREQFQKQRQALQAQIREQMKKLEEEQRSQLEKLRRARTDLMRRPNAPEKPNAPAKPEKSSPPSAGGDKLDQILQRLERMEKRLDRLEKNKD